MGSAFWEQMAAGNLNAIETMGEDLELGGETVQGIVDEQSFREGAAAGGRRTLVSCKVQIMADLALHDGMAAKVRGLDGKVEGWENLGPGAGRIVSIGPFNRWSGDIPGL